MRRPGTSTRLGGQSQGIGRLGLGVALAIAAAVTLNPAHGLAGSMLYPSSKREAGALKLAQVTGLASRAQILGFKKDLQRLLDSGIPDSAIVDRSIGQGRVYCCGGLPEAAQLDALRFYIPPDVAVDAGDIVEIQLGHAPNRHDPGKVNVVTRVRESATATEPHCRWEPQDPGKWMRVIYCDWMEAEGWTHKSGIGNPWLKFAASDSIP